VLIDSSERVFQFAYAAVKAHNREEEKHRTSMNRFAPRELYIVRR
jgi:hypothetical protein